MNKEMEENFLWVNEKLWRGDRYKIAHKVGCTFPTVFKALRKPVSELTELDIAIIKEAKKLVRKHELTLSKIIVK